MEGRTAWIHGARLTAEVATQLHTNISSGPVMVSGKINCSKTKGHRTWYRNTANCLLPDVNMTQEHTCNYLLPAVNMVLEHSQLYTASW